jgi:hypothetical protein
MMQERAMCFRDLRFRGQPGLASLRFISVTALSAAALLASAVCAANARDFEMGGDGSYSIMAPEPGTGSHHAAGNRHGRASRHQSQSLTATEKALQDSEKALQDSASITSPLHDTPEQIETFKRNRRATAWRGSSGIVLPTPLPGPTHYGPVGTPAAPLRSVEQPGPTILPGSGRAIPNLPHGPETSQDRASRCAYQSAINNIHAGQFGNYMASCM